MLRSAAIAIALGFCVGLCACEGSEDTVGEAGPTTSTGTGVGAGGGGGATSTGTVGTGGGGGSVGGAGGGEPVGTEGCGQPLSDSTEQWVAKTVDVDGAPRDYFVYLPAGYDASRPYPVVYQFHGCSGNVDKQNNHPPVQDYAGGEAIHIRGRAVGDCWDTAADGTGVAFFDAVVPEVEATWCADSDRRFATGYSSGSFMSHRLSCVRGDMLRGVATIAGGVAGQSCVDRTAALLIHDEDDTTVNISTSEQARDRHLASNGCDAQAPTTPGDHPPCEVYADCDPGYPVVWCQTSGNDHGRQDSLSAPAFWDFIGAL